MSLGAVSKQLHVLYSFWSSIYLGMQATAEIRHLTAFGSV